MVNRLPLIYLVDSAGVMLPLQDDVFPDEDDFGRIFRNNAVLSALGVPQIAAIMGNCVAGGGYLPVLCDKLIMTEGSGLYLAGPALVKSAIGQDVGHEELGGAQDARGDQRHDRLPRSRRRRGPGPGAGAGRPCCPSIREPPNSAAVVSVAPARAARRHLPGRLARAAGIVRSPRRARLPGRCRQLSGIQGRLRADGDLRLRPDRRV